MTTELTKSPGVDPIIDGVLISFVPRDAQLHIGIAPNGRTSRSISMHIDVAPDEDVRLLNDRSLKHSLWHLSLTEGPTYNEWATQHGGIGVVSSSSDHQGGTTPPNECFISAALKDDIFSPLLTAIQSGRLPSRVVVGVLGMKYGWEPDGEGKVWNLSTTQTLPLTEVRFDVPLAVLPNSSLDPSVEPSGSDNLPATSNDARLLGRHLSEQLTSMRREMGGRSMALLVLVALACLLLFLRR